MKFLVEDESGYYFPKGSGEILMDEEAFEKIANDYHKYEMLEITSIKDGIVSVWIHFPNRDY